jgi:alpha-N-arabinofuranosidase
MVKENAYVADHSPHINAPGNKPVGIYQEELGVLKDKLYSGYIILAGDSNVGPVKVSLVCEGIRDTHVIESTYTEFVKVPFMLRAGADSDNASLEITAHGKGTLKIGTVSIMPADNVDGFRKDTLELLRQLSERWCMFPFPASSNTVCGCRDRNTARATLGIGLAVSAFPRYVPV